MWASPLASACPAENGALLPPFLLFLILFLFETWIASWGLTQGTHTLSLWTGLRRSATLVLLFLVPQGPSPLWVWSPSSPRLYLFNC
jgi:hypothetical protein